MFVMIMKDLAKQKQNKKNSRWISNKIWQYIYFFN